MSKLTQFMRVKLPKKTTDTFVPFSQNDIDVTYYLFSGNGSIVHCYCC